MTLKKIKRALKIIATVAAVALVVIEKLETGDVAQANTVTRR